MILPRVVTALVAAPLFLWVIYLGSLPFMVFVLCLVLLALWEYQQMAEEGGYATQSLWVVAGGMLMALSLSFPGVRVQTVFTAQAPSLCLVLVVAFLTLREMLRRDKSLSMLRLATSFLGILLIAWPLGHLFLLRDLRGVEAGGAYHLGRNAVFFLVFLMWIQDTAAWAVGLSVGKRRLAAQISPKKSWEGAAGGLLAAVLLAMFLREVWMRDLFGRAEAAALGAALGVLGQVSDLAESLMKRCFGVKDSSHLLPGHGGVLDRFDSFLFTSPFLYYYLIITGRGG